MDPTLPMDQLLPGGDPPLDFSATLWALVIAGAILLRLLPVLIAIGAIVKWRRFPSLRPLHGVLLFAVALTGLLALIDTAAPTFVPTAIRASGTWSYLWIFAVAWVAVTWLRSAIKTGLRPRWIDGATLAALVLFLLAAGLLVLPTVFAR